MTAPPDTGRRPLICSRRISLAALAVAVLWPGSSMGVERAGHALRDRGAHQPAPVLVEGVVVDYETGEPVPGATVSLDAGAPGTTGAGTRVTDEGGRFRFQDVPAGTYVLHVNSHDHLEMINTFEVSGEEDLDLILPVSTQDIELEPLLREREPPTMAMRGFDARRRRGGGFLVTREEILERRPRYVSELLHRVPGGTVSPTTPYGYALLLRGRCQPGIWVDGTPVPGVTSIDQLVGPMDVHAVEVYHGFELPVEFGVDACGGVLVWTRTRPTGARSVGSNGDAGVIAPVLKTLALVLLVFLVTR